MESKLVLNLNRKAMRKIENDSKSVLEMLFEKRNKLYGAYAIRSAYNLTLIKSMFATMVFFITACFSAYVYFKKKAIAINSNASGNLETKFPTFIVKPIDLSPAIEEIKKNRNEKPQKKETVAQVIKENSGKEESKVTNNNTDEKTQSGSDKKENSNTETNPCSNCDVINVKKPADEKIEFVADEMPEFPGGVNALMRFITNKLIYPEKARILELEGTVVVNFVVDEEGKITNVKFLKSLGGGCEEEVERVLRLMPLWKPGKSAGKNVKVYYNLPVRFRFQ